MHDIKRGRGSFRPRRSASPRGSRWVCKGRGPWSRCRSLGLSGVNKQQLEGASQVEKREQKISQVTVARMSLPRMPAVVYVAMSGLS
jgi:hypothetical protein